MSDKLYGLMAEFDSATELVDAAKAVREAGYTKTDAFSPFPLHDIDEALGVKRSILPVLVFFGGITGLMLGVALQVFVHLMDYRGRTIRFSMCRGLRWLHAKNSF